MSDNETTIAGPRIEPPSPTFTDPTPPVPANDVARRNRVLELMTQRGRIDREIAWLTMNLGDDGRPWWHCMRCGHRWQSYRPAAPKTCSNCHSPAWQTARRAYKSRAPYTAPGRQDGRIKRHVGRPTRTEVALELAMLREKLDKELEKDAEKLVGKDAGWDSIPPDEAGLPPLPPPPRSLSDELHARRMPNPPTPDPEPEPAEPDPDVEPPEDSDG